MTFLVTAGCDYESKNNAGHLAVDMAGWRIQTKNVLISIIKTVTIKKDQIKNRRRSADDTASSLFGIMNSLKRLELDSGKHCILLNLKIKINPSLKIPYRCIRQ